MRSSLTRLLVLLVVAMALVPAGFAMGQSDSEAPTPDADEKLTFTVGTTGDLTSVNLFKACCATDYEMMALAYDLLHNYDPDTLAAVPGLAESYEVSEDKKTWTFKIREGVKWSDGRPLTAHDVAFTYNFMLNNKGTGAFNNYLGVAKSFSAPDDTTFIWEMKEATTAPLTPPYIPILPEHIWKVVDGGTPADIDGFRNVPTVGSGAFVLEEWKPGEFLRMSANKEYWDGAPVIDEVVFQVFQNQEAMVQALKSGEIDAAEAIEPALFESLKSDPTIQTAVTNENAVYDIAFNLKQGKNAQSSYGDTISTSHPALQDANVRRAIAHSIDKQTLVDTVLQGYGRPADSFLLPVFSKWYKPATGDQVYDFDIDRANQIYDEGGYLDTDGDGVREMPGGGEPFNFELVALADDPYSLDSAKLIRGWMESTGWNVDLIPTSETKANDLWGTSNFDAYVWYWDGEPDPDFMLSVFTTDQCGYWSDGCYSNPKYDALFDSQRVEPDLDARQETVFEMTDIFYEDVPLISLFYTTDRQAYRKDRWTGFVPQPAPNGSLIYSWGPDSYQNITPVKNADGTTVISTTGKGGVSGIVWIALAAIVAVVVGLGVRMLRRKNDEDMA